MTLAQFITIARTQWLLVIAATVLGAFGAAAYSWSQTPIYQATSQMWVSTRAGESSITTLSAGSTFTQQRVKSYAAIITAPEVMAGVVKDLGLTGISPDQLAGQVTATAQENTVLLDVTVRDTSPERARDIANSVPKQFSSFVMRLELPSGSGTSPVKISVTTPAVAPAAPVSPKSTFNLLLGLFLGLAAGTGAAILRDSLDRTIGTRHDVGALTGAPVLAAIAEDADAKEKPLIVHDAFSGRAEAFRQLRTNIRFLSVDHEVRSLVVTSSLPGEGKSTTSANLAIAMAQSGERVVLIDADLRRPSIGDMFMLPSGIGLTSVLLGDAPPADAVQKWRDDLGLWVLASGPIPPNPSELIGSHRMVEIVETLVAEGYMVIVDSPPLLPVTDAAILARITAGALLVARVTSTRVDQLTAAAETLRTAGAPLLGALVNRLPKTSAGYYSYGGYSATGAPNHRPAAAPAPLTPLFGLGMRGATDQDGATGRSRKSSRRRSAQAVAPPVLPTRAALPVPPAAQAAPAAPAAQAAQAAQARPARPARPAAPLPPSLPVTTPAPPAPPIDLRYMNGGPDRDDVQHGAHANGHNGHAAHPANRYTNGYPNGHRAAVNGYPEVHVDGPPAPHRHDMPTDEPAPQRRDAPPSIQIDVQEQLRQLGRRRT